MEEVENTVVVAKKFPDEFSFKKVRCCKYDVISHVVRILLTINHGQAYVERGFSQNADVNWNC